MIADTPHLAPKSRLGLALAALALGLAACGTTTYYDYDEPAPRPRPSSAEQARCERYLPLARAIAEEHGLDWALLAAIAQVESRWTPQATSRAGARGLMQVMPATGRRLRCGDLLDPESNLRCGARLLDRLLRRYDGAVVYALSAYAAGPKLPDRAFERGDKPPRERFIGRVERAAAHLRARGCTP